ncbi:OLC1v1001718C3 [Oldenlandia corymbosa var. corymbosa]|uniref:OLC1v1001718C3 n=1 Tax=Oldenlandia corymbosa var. corymbosa TaxID=529605 RepID=A0AAV1D5W1_OLDCO|nr:OLC1v1001718C3 [Oldenlandia corymbosa var. corymbosa]
MEELYFEKKRNIKRRLMEMSSSSSSNQVGAEVRRLHVIYFLSRKGRIEHPHLIRVHHLSRNGVHLRDVKRWLAELRGKDMPESFAWSYKRRYRSGYVWQDLLDEDLITPISDNEYVLKGSEISSSSPKEEANMGKKYSMQKGEDNGTDIRSPSFQEEHQDHHHQENKRQQESTKMSSPEIIEEESHTFGSDKSSTLTEDYVDHQEEKQSSRSSCEISSKQEIHEEEEEEEVVKVEKPPSLHPRKRSNKKATNTDVSFEEKTTTSTPSAATPASQPSFSKSKSNGGSLFRNLITCGAIDTNDSAMVTVNRRNKTSMNDEDSTSFSKELLLKGDKLGGSQRVSSATNWLQTKQSSGRKSFDGVRASPKKKHDYGTPKAVNPAYKPIYGPQCSQCGKPFKPEKMHAHMKSCKGMKAWTRYSGTGISAAAEKAVKTSAESQNNLIPGHSFSHSLDFRH